jgi:hypothetical protein
MLERQREEIAKPEGKCIAEAIGAAKKVGSPPESWCSPASA